MQDLTPEGQRALQDIANRHGVSLDAATTLFLALMRGNGYQAQFSHPELGGMGQWSQGGMIMVGDMFNNGLKYRVDTLCNELAGLVHAQPGLFAPPPSAQYQGQGNGNVSFFRSGSGNWWPAALGSPSSSGAQNDLRYAFFPQARRLAIQVGGDLRLYDTGEHQIGGVSQQQSGDQSLTFTSQFGLVRLWDLPQVPLDRAAPNQPAPVAPAAPQNVPTPRADEPTPVPIPMPAPEPTPTRVAEPAPQDAQSQQSAHEILTTIERLAELRRKDILTEEEFAAKKAALLSRL